MAKKRASVQARYRFQYAAKFLGTSNIPGTSQTTSALLPGVSQTAVNIHNPQRESVEPRRKLAVAGGDVPPFDLHLIHGFEGFLLIESRKL